MFEEMLRARITKRDIAGDWEQIILQICRKFQEEKKKCGAEPRGSSDTWNCFVPDLKKNPRKGFDKNCMKFSR